MANVPANTIPQVVYKAYKVEVNGIPLPAQFWYLGSPYSKYKDGLEAAFRIVAENAALLIKNRINVHCPICHTHPIAEYGKLDHRNHDLWLPADQPFIDHAKGLIILKMDGWDESVGLNFEIDEFHKSGRPVIFMNPGEIPVDLLFEEGRICSIG